MRLSTCICLHFRHFISLSVRVIVSFLFFISWVLSLSHYYIILLNCWVADPHQFNADPDPDFHFNAYPYPAIYFHPDSVLIIFKVMQSVTTGLQSLQNSILNLQAFFVSVHGNPWLCFEPLKLPLEGSVFPGMLNLLFFCCTVQNTVLPILQLGKLNCICLPTVCDKTELLALAGIFHSNPVCLPLTFRPLLLFPDFPMVLMRPSQNLSHLFLFKNNVFPSPSALL
jgi:hypothetical protein